jgi:type II secretory pathway pseudopilin PulG
VEDDLMIRTKRQEHGFTAVEIAMVATVIAILALLILPLFRTRTEEAKITAARDDMRSIAIAQMAAMADTGYYFRPQDLDNTQQMRLPILSDRDVPVAVWNGALSQQQRASLMATWKGPYTSLPKYTTYETLTSTPPAGKPYLFQSASGEGGAIMDLISRSTALDGEPKVVSSDPPLDKFPIDPWGNPYLFFGTGRRNELSSAQESDYGTAIIYSLGPDGQAGNGRGYDPRFYVRETGFLGEDPDDLVFEF